ncbi:MAG: hypothetical protein JJU00_11875 [Opitutales bacterium]|nr:hypothetical protein [Opitutales bacterium]
MNRPDNDPLEAELAGLRPKPLPPVLEQRLRAAPVRGAAARLPALCMRARFILPLAAVLFLSLGGIAVWMWTHGDADPGSPAVARTDPADTAAPSPRMRPVRAENYLANRIDEGVFIVGNHIAARQYRYQFVDTVVWEDPRDGTTVEMSVPREEIVLVPIHSF